MPRLRKIWGDLNRLSLAILFIFVTRVDPFSSSRMKSDDDDATLSTTRQTVSISPAGFPIIHDDIIASNPIYDDIASELQDLATTHNMVERQQQSKSRNKLQPRHMPEFPSQSLFDRFARVVCQARVIPRKELFETWAMALYVHRTFPSAQRIADIACSHGLLSWALMLLARYDETTGQPMVEKLSSDDQSVKHHISRETLIQRSVVCIDLHMPKSAEKIATKMLEEWPEMKDYWDYVEGPLEALIPSSTTLLVGIHACGLLSDKIVSHTIQGRCNLALVPCCHSKKGLAADQKSLLASPSLPNSYSLADFIDHYRTHRLEQAGFEVQQATIPQEFTPKNRIIVAKPSETARNVQRSKVVEPQSMRAKDKEGDEIPEWAKPKFMIPVADTLEDRAIVRELAGREAALARNQKPARFVHLSLFLPENNIHLSAQDLAPVVPVAGAQVKAICPKPYLHPNAGRYVRTYKVTFPNDASKMQCRDYSKLIRERIPKMIPGASVRY